MADAMHNLQSQVVTHRIRSYSCRKGCPKCSGKARLTHEEAVARLAGRSMQPLSEYPGVEHRWPILCTVCGHRWSPNAGSILHRKLGCPKCGQRAKPTEEEAVAKIFHKTLKPMGRYQGINAALGHVVHGLWS